MFCCKDMKGCDCLGILSKILGIVAFAFFVITIWPAAMTWVHSVNPWFFLIASIVFVAIFKLRFLNKGKVGLKKKK